MYTFFTKERSHGSPRTVSDEALLGHLGLLFWGTLGGSFGSPWVGPVLWRLSQELKKVVSIFRVAKLYRSMVWSSF